MALGATPSGVVAMVVSQASRPVVAGIAGGLTVIPLDSCLGNHALRRDGVRSDDVRRCGRCVECRRHVGVLRPRHAGVPHRSDGGPAQMSERPSQPILSSGTHRRVTFASESGAPDTPVLAADYNPSTSWWRISPVSADAVFWQAPLRSCPRSAGRAPKRHEADSSRHGRRPASAKSQFRLGASHRQQWRGVRD